MAISHTKAWDVAVPSKMVLLNLEFANSATIASNVCSALLRYFSQPLSAFMLSGPPAVAVTCLHEWCPGQQALVASLHHALGLPQSTESCRSVSKLGRILHASKKKIPGSGNVGTCLFMSL